MKAIIISTLLLIALISCNNSTEKTVIETTGYTPEQMDSMKIWIEKYLEEVRKADRFKDNSDSAELSRQKARQYLPEQFR